MKTYIETEILCLDKENENLGIEGNDIWLPCIINKDILLKCDLIKCASGNEDTIQYGKTAIYMENDNYVISISFDRFLKWIKENNEIISI